MKVIRVKDSLEGGALAFTLLKEKMAQGARTFGLATGSTPLDFYRQMRASNLDFSECVTVNLDEYVGLGREDSQSYAYFMEEHLFQHKSFKASYLPNGLAEDLTAEVQAYNDLLAEHPVDFQILGIGNNGHIGFNEPGTPFDAQTQVVDLAESTIAANARFFDNPNQVPRQAISMGISNIMAAKCIVLMAYGDSKASAIKATVQGPVTTAVPASVLQTHPEVYLIVDEAAVALLD